MRRRLNYAGPFMAVIMCAAISLPVFSCREVDDGNKSETKKTARTSSVMPAAGHTVRVRYFHTTARCQTCRRLEEYTRKAIDRHFGAHLKRGVVSFSAVNVEVPENQHFVKDYSIYTKSVILEDVAGGKVRRWKNLDRTWELVKDREGFIDYIKNEIEAFVDSTHG